MLHSYDSGGRLTQVTDTNGGIWKYIYDANNNMTSVTDPRSISYLTNKYDSLNRVYEQDLANGGKYLFSYNASGCADTPAGRPAPKAYPAFARRRSPNAKRAYVRQHNRPHLRPRQPG